MAASEVASKAYEKAVEANEVAVIALTKIEEHEKSCTIQWKEFNRRINQQTKIHFLILTTMVSVLGVLLYDKIIVG